MSRWMIGTIAAFFVVYVLTMLITGEPTWIIPGVILFALAMGYALLNRAMTKRIMQRHGGDAEAAMRDRDEDIPSAHLIAEDERPAGDTPEVHDEINPHDLPKDHPGREAAVERAGGQAGTTTGDESRFQRAAAAQRGDR